MALILADRVKESSTTTGSGPFTLDGALTGHVAFSAVCSVSDTCYYVIQEVDGLGSPTGAWEVGLGTYSSANTLTRTTVTASSNANTAVTFSAGTKHVFITLTASQLNGLAVLGKQNGFTKAQAVATVALTPGTTVNVDASLSNNFRLVAAQNFTLSNPTNLTDGQVLNFRIKQDATGSRIITYGTNYKFPSGAVTTLSTAANSVDLLTCIYDGTDAVMACSLIKGY